MEELWLTSDEDIEHGFIEARLNDQSFELTGSTQIRFKVFKAIARIPTVMANGQNEQFVLLPSCGTVSWLIDIDHQ